MLLAYILEGRARCARLAAVLELRPHPGTAVGGGRFPPCENGRGDRIRTCDLFTPSEARYQAALHPDN